MDNLHDSTEPVAFFDPQSEGFYWAKPTKVIPPVTVNVEPLPLYTSPPAQRTWVDLTDVERHECTQFPFSEMNHRAIEAKLRSKNEDRN